MMLYYKPAYGRNLIIWRCLNAYSKTALAGKLGISLLQYEWLEQFGLGSRTALDKLVQLSEISGQEWKLRDFEDELSFAAQEYSDFFSTDYSMYKLIQVTLQSQVSLDQNVLGLHEAFGRVIDQPDADFIANELGSTLQMNWKMISICLRRWLTINNMVKT